MSQSSDSETSLYRAPDSETATSSSPRVPQELCDKIMAFVSVEYDPDRDIDSQDRYLTMRQCALVCRAWLPSARSHIFRVVRLSQYGGADRLLGVLTLNATLAQYMTCVILALDWATDDLDLIAGLVPKLTAVKELYLSARNPGADGPLSWDSEYDFDLEEASNLANVLTPVLRSPKLAVMHLNGFSFTSRDEFLQFVGCSSSLDILALRNIHLSPRLDWRSEADPGYAQRRSKIQISQLGIHSYDAVLASWLLHPSFPIAVAPLTGLSIRLEDVGDMRDFLPLLNEVGSSLKELGISLPPRCEFKKHRHFSGIVDAIPTLPNTNIEHLIITGFDRRDPSIGVYTKHFDGAEFVQGLLLRLSAPQKLQRVTIDELVTIIWRRAGEFPNLQWHNWQAVDEVLTRDIFSNVRYLDFYAGLNKLELDRDEVRSCITPQFSAFRRRRGSLFTLTVHYTNFAWTQAFAARDEDSYSINSADV
ncbi:hypothetical protein B0H15DRAFT_559857 [Mycena belliarum]|uniref:F-box domain-containing protein n=1 Tax=Mycena belliarum TaxID=1033014 RepID=A0AAD6TV99_9AGAR|nr:hypothetical protein B0H15DRAFT_559857 [Mycena belliae]